MDRPVTVSCRWGPLALVVTAALGGLAAVRWAAWTETAQQTRRVDALIRWADEGPRCASAFSALPALAGVPTGATLASWQTVGGCGAGAGAGAARGIRWVGRRASGGAFEIQCLTGLTSPAPDQRDLSLDTQITRDLTDRWSVGMSLPYIHKTRRHFPRADLELSNKGPGDLGLLVHRKLGSTRATTISLWAGLPTGESQAHWQLGGQRAPLPQDLQLGSGGLSATAILDHTVDRDWGLITGGLSAGYPGGASDLGNARAPSASLFGYAGYLLGPFVPAAGLALTGATAADQSLNRSTANPRLTLALNLSLEWSADWIAILAGVSLPWAPASGLSALQPWVLGLGFTAAPF